MTFEARWDAPADIVAFLNSGLPIDLDVQFHEVLSAALSDPAFVESPNSLDRPGQRTNFLFEFFGRRCIKKFADGHPQQIQAAEHDHNAGQQGSPIVGRFVTGSANQPNADTDEGRNRSQGISPVVPGIGLQ